MRLLTSKCAIVGDHIETSLQRELLIVDVSQSLSVPDKQISTPSAPITNQERSYLCPFFDFAQDLN